MNNLVTFMGQNDDGKRLVGIGLTDEMIEHIKKAGGLVQDSERTGTDTDITILYAPTLNELMAKVNSVIPKDKRDLRFT